MLRNNFSNLQRIRHFPGVTQDGSDHLSNIIFSPFTTDDRKTSWYTRSIEAIHKFSFDFFAKDAEINGIERLGDLKNDKEGQYFKISTYNSRRLYDLKIDGDVQEFELILIEGTHARFVQRFEPIVVETLKLEGYRNCRKIPWGFNFALQNSLDISLFPNDSHFLLRVIGDCISVYAEYIQLSSEEIQHYRFSPEIKPFEIIQWVSDDEIRDGDIIYGFNLVGNYDEYDDINFVYDNNVILNCKAWCIADGWRCFEPSTQNIHKTSLMYTNTISINKTVIWLVGREFII